MRKSLGSKRKELGEKHGEWGVLKAGCVNWGKYREEENKALPPGVAPEYRHEVQKGDVLMSRASGSPELIGSVASVEDTRGQIMLSDKIFRLVLTPVADPRFVTWMFASSQLRGQIVNAISGAEGMATNLPQGRIKEFLCAIPPLGEQSSIASFLQNKTAKYDALTSAAETTVHLLNERCNALISAAVTGKINVRSAASVQTEAA